MPHFFYEEFIRFRITREKRVLIPGEFFGVYPRDCHRHLREELIELEGIFVMDLEVGNGSQKFNPR